jgi:8-oxo-dGTP pyrophosphatase MutT (NUDIX family)
MAEDMNSEIEVYEHKPEGFSPAVEVAAIYVNVGEKLLLLKLSHLKREAGKWSIPAGKIEANESAVQGAKRELFEETGIDVISEDALHSFGRLYICKPDIHYIYHLFGVELQDLPSVQLSDEHLSYQWASRQEAEALPLMSGGKQALDFYFQQSKSR